MKIGVLGTGMVGKAIANKLVALGHQVMMGARSASSEAATEWAKTSGGSNGSFADAAAFGELVFLCTKGDGALAAVEAAGQDNLAGKVLLDITNPIDFSRGMPPTLFVFGTDSLGEQIQRALPNTQVVKTLNTIGSEVMVDPGRVPGEHTVFVSGNDAAAKGKVTELLRGWFGWRDVLDLGDITTARGTEAYLLFWLRLWGATKTADVNVQVRVKA